MPVSGPLESGGDALVANPLSQFAATTSAQFAGVISDEVGTGFVILQTSPTFITPTTDDLIFTGRLKLDKGGDVASAGIMTLGADGNVFDITGTTTIDEIDPTNWNVGSVIHLQFDGAVQVTHNSGGTNDILLGDQTNWTTAAGDVLTLFFDGTDWVEVSRSEISSGADNLGNHTATQDLAMATFDIDNAGVIFLVEQAAANGDIAGEGQIWVKNTTPNQLWFTDDAGTDTQLGAADNLGNHTATQVIDSGQYGIQFNSASQTAIGDAGGLTYSIGSSEIHDFVINSVSSFTISNTTIGLNSLDIDNAGVVFLKEQAAANADQATLGQIWVKNTTPNELWFTDDGGTDFNIGSLGDHVATAPLNMATFDLHNVGVMFIQEQAAANPDQINKGQIWVKDTVPNELWFTDVAGTDFQLGIAADNLGNHTATQDLAMGTFDIDNAGVIFLVEQAAANVDIVGEGQLWVKDTTPNELWFTDDAGTDFQLGTAADNLGNHTATQDLAMATFNIDNAGLIYLVERTTSDGDIAGQGQIWVKDTTPNELWFTDDAGTDFQLGVAADNLGNHTATQDLAMGTFDIDNAGVMFLVEQAAANADIAGEGQIWVKDTTPNELWFTDDAGSDFQLGGSADNLGNHTATQDLDLATFDIDNVTDITLAGRLKLDKGGDVVSSGIVTLGADGNVFDITGTTTINEILPTNWSVGNQVTLQFDGALQVTHNSGGTNDILLGDQTNWTTAAGDVLTLFYNGTDWAEVSRSEVGSGADNLGNHIATQNLDLATFDIDNAGVVFLKEQAAANSDEAGEGQIWVKDTVPNELWFTDDAGTDFQLGIAADNLGNHTATQIIDSGQYGVQFNSASQTTVGDAGGLTYSVGSSEIHDFVVNSVSSLTISDTTVGLNNLNIDYAGVVFLKEQAAANVDQASLGQIWVKDTVPNELWFTDDAGTDFQLGVAVDNLGNHTATQDLAMATFDINNAGVIYLVEQAAANADIAGEGQIWVRYTTPNQLWFTDDAGTDFQLGIPADNLGNHTATQNLDLATFDIDNAGVIFLKEQAAANSDEAGEGQIWVKNTTPNQLWFTDDAGTDTQLGIAASFTDAGTFAYLTTTTDDLVIGGTSQNTYNADTAGLDVSNPTQIFRFVSTNTISGVLVGSIRGNQVTSPVDTNSAGFSLTLDNDANVEQEFGRISWIADDVSSGTEDGAIELGISVAGTKQTGILVRSTGLEVSDGSAPTSIQSVLINVPNAGIGKFQVGTPADADHFDTQYDTDNDKIDLLIRGDNCVRFTKATATSDVNLLIFVSSDTGVATQIQCGGTDTDCDIEIAPKGTGNVLVNNTLSFKTTFNIGTAASSQAINWNDGTYQKVVLDSGGSQTFTFTAPSGPARLVLKLTENATGGSTITWPTMENSDPSHNTTADAVTLYIIEYIDGTYWFEHALI